MSSVRESRRPMRLVMITNETREGNEAGLREAFGSMAARGEIASFQATAPAAHGGQADSHRARKEVLQLVEAESPDVLLVLSPKRLSPDAEWVRALRTALGAHGRILYWEGDPWSRWRKPPAPAMRLWAAAADVVFSVALEPQSELLQRLGARRLEFIPHTYCHVQFKEAEESDPTLTPTTHDVAVVGSRLAHFGLVSRLPGARERGQLVRRLQKEERLSVAVYGRGWRGRGALGAVPYEDQISELRRARITANWDHFPRHAAYASDRLPVSMLAGRPHVTTAHPGSGWMPSEAAGLFVEPSPKAVVRRVLALAERPSSELMELGAEAHRWVAHRLSDREAARFMLGAVEPQFRETLPPDPWARLPRIDARL